MALTAVAFDLDETLAVTRIDRETLLTEALDSVDLSPLPREAYLAAHGDNLTARSREPVFEALLDRADLDADPAALARAYRERINDSLDPVVGIEGLLATLRERYRLGLLTNGSVLAQRSKLERLGWEDTFDAALVTGDLPAGKPDPAAFEALVEALDTAPSETAFVGDDVEADVRGAANAGLHTVQVLVPGGPAPDPAADAHVEREHLVERLPAVLDRLG